MSSSDPKINLIWLTEDKTAPEWEMGDVLTCKPYPMALSECLNAHLDQSLAAAWLFWDPAFSLPSSAKLIELLSSCSDCWHAGLRLGLAGLPEWINFVSPTWMLNRDPDPIIEATSWRLSLRACLIRSKVLDQLGGPISSFSSLTAASLELGYRYIRKGVFIRHVPSLLDKTPGKNSIDIPLTDKLRFIQAGFSRMWLAWTCFRAVLRGTANPIDLIKALRAVKHESPLSPLKAYMRQFDHKEKPDQTGKVSVLIPTVHRYPYLKVLLNQLRGQSMPPYEVIIVDQTPKTERDLDLLKQFNDLPLRWLFLEQAGQCRSRNMGLQESKGDYILFIDDDDEIPHDLIEKHLINLHQLDVNISNGVAHETGTGELPEDFSFTRHSNVFPTNNTMIRKHILVKSGLFDLAYDHGQRADHDLGMRLYLSGELMVLNPEIAVLHHHAPTGGLREHKARVNTYAASRQQIFKRNLPSVSDVYLAKRYFSKQQVREMLWISVLGTFSLKGSIFKRLLKLLVGVFSLPQALWIIKKKMKKADQLIKQFPQIPHLNRANYS